MGRPRKVKTPEEQREYNARRKEQNRLAQQRRRQNAAALAQDAERKRQARQDPAYAAREAERKRQARRDDEERREAENAAKRRKYHTDQLANFKGANSKFKNKWFIQFVMEEFALMCFTNATQPTTIHGSCIDLTLAKNISTVRTENLSVYHTDHKAVVNVVVK